MFNKDICCEWYYIFFWAKKYQSIETLALYTYRRLYSVLDYLK